jgi:hypothetical protein
MGERIIKILFIKFLKRKRGIMTEFSKKYAIAIILDCQEEDIIAWRELADGGVTVIGPTGQKFTYSKKQLKDAVQSSQLNSKGKTTPLNPDVVATKPADWKPEDPILGQPATKHSRHGKAQ